ncbi:UNVERIFIED_CONTAM: hypothetical protein Sradi_3215300 [Sesamum radiatum]|uniref:Uncharacterized protein n=1 Tax=Sesamum radiatum TaxID=300843 RepID=A0AAW2RI07_SESRA
MGNRRLKLFGGGKRKVVGAKRWGAKEVWQQHKMEWWLQPRAGREYGRVGDEGKKVGLLVTDVLR